MNMIRIRRSSVAVVGLALLAALLVGPSACSDWDAAVGVRCNQYPSFCRAKTPSGGVSADGGGSSADAGGDGAIVFGPKTVSFSRDIRPLMNRTETDPAGPGCSMCHYRTNGGAQMGINEGQLDMTTLGDLRRGGKTSGAGIIIPGNPNGSALVQKLRGTYASGSRMPWNGPPYWKDEEIERVATWIAEGAQGADDE